MRVSKLNIVILAVLFLAMSSCKKDIITAPEQPESYKYLHLSHTRGATGLDMVDGVESVDYSKYDVLMLGGDLLQNTTLTIGAVEKIDSLFDIGNDNTLWSIGNHDDWNVSYIPTYTNRPLHYAYHKKGITYLVLDSERDDCSILESQLTLFNAVADTIKESSHLVIMTHKLIWMIGNSHLEPIADSVTNGGLGPNTWSIKPNNFYDDLYWRLLDIQNKGIQVICIGGDLGIHTSGFEFRFDSGIQFLGSGVYYNNPDQKGLVFEHTPSKRTLTWEYVDLTDL